MSRIARDEPRNAREDDSDSETSIGSMPSLRDPSESEDDDTEMVEPGYTSPAERAAPGPSSGRIGYESDDDDRVSIGTNWDEFDEEMAQLGGLDDWQVPSHLSPLALANIRYPITIDGCSNNSVVVNGRGKLWGNKFVVACTSTKRVLAHRSDTKQEAVWLLDSGASLHFTNDIRDFVQYTPLKEEIIVTTANGRTKASGVGTVILFCKAAHGRARASVRIAPVYYMPELTSRLLSMGEFLRDGLEVRGSSSCIALHKPDGRLFLTFYPREKDDTIFCVKSADSAQALSANTLVSRVNYDTMHRRLAHPSRDVLTHARDHTNGFPQIIFPRDVPVCRGCAEGKMPLRPFRPSAKRASRPFQIIHTDLKSFPIASYRKNLYFAGFLDDCTSHAWLYFLKKKDATLPSTRQFLAYVENQYDAKVQQWMSDGGGEYKSDAFDGMLKERGIKILQSAPHTPQQNGRAERLMRTLMDKAEAMRIDAGLPDSWWEFAVQHAVHVYNRTPMKRLGWKTPYELLHGEAPDISHLRVFGCGAYVHIPPETRKNKLAPKSELMIYLGPAPGGHGNIFMRISTNVVYTSAHALFDETLFPKRAVNTKRLLDRLPNDVPDFPLHLDDDNDDEEPRQPPKTPVKKGKEPAHRKAPTPPRAVTPAPPPEVPVEEEILPPRVRKVPTKPGNVYGEKTHPVDIEKRISNVKDWENLVGEDGDRNPEIPQGSANAENVPGPSSARTPSPEAGEQQANIPGPSHRESASQPGSPRDNQESIPTTPVIPIAAEPDIYNDMPPLVDTSDDEGEDDAEDEQSDEGEEDDESDEPEAAPQVPPPEVPQEDSDEEEESGSEDSEDNEDSEEDSGSGDSSDEVENALRLVAEVSELAEQALEGGVGLTHLLMKAIPPVKVRPSNNIREWTYKDILRLPEDEQREWKRACEEELEALRRRNVFELVDRPEGHRVLKNRWVFDQKTDGRKKGRLVAKGHTQVEGVDYDKLFSPVVRFETVRLMLALAALEGWHIEGLDVRNAYLYGELEEELYMEQPEGFLAKGQEHKVLRLRRALYGLKQAGLAWWRALDNSMKLMGFVRLKSDAGLFLFKSNNGFVLVIIYVDDALFCGKNKQIVRQMKAKFMKRWECRDLGETSEFLRMRIRRNGDKFLIDQCPYLDKVIANTGMQNAKSAPTPLPAGYIPAPNPGQSTPELRSRYQTVIGSLLYIMLGTRPDISFAVTKLAQFASNPSVEHLNKALYVVRYLIGTRNYSLVYDGAKGMGLIACTDSDWASDPHTRRSQTGFYLKLAGGIFSWTSRAQRTIAHSSTEAEYMALSDCSRQVMWIRSLLGELGYKLHAIPISGDNQGSLFMASNPITESRSKHIDIRYHYIREVVEAGHVEVFFIDGNDNPADLFTKNLGHIKFLRFRSQLGLIFPDDTKRQQH